MPAWPASVHRAIREVPAATAMENWTGPMFVPVKRSPEILIPTLTNTPKPRPPEDSLAAALHPGTKTTTTTTNALLSPAEGKATMTRKNSMPLLLVPADVRPRARSPNLPRDSRNPGSVLKTNLCSQNPCPAEKVKNSHCSESSCFSYGAWSPCPSGSSTKSRAMPNGSSYGRCASC